MMRSLPWKPALILLAALALLPLALIGRGQPAPAAPAAESQELVQAAERVMAVIEGQEHVQRITPESILFKAAWQHRLYEARRDAAATRDARLKAAEAYAAAMQKAEEQVASRASIDASAVQVEIARYYAAEARVLLAKARAEP